MKLFVILHLAIFYDIKKYLLIDIQSGLELISHSFVFIILQLYEIESYNKLFIQILKIHR